RSKDSQQRSVCSRSNCTPVPGSACPEVPHRPSPRYPSPRAGLRLAAGQPRAGRDATAHCALRTALLPLRLQRGRSSARPGGADQGGPGRTGAHLGPSPAEAGATGRREPVLPPSLPPTLPPSFPPVPAPSPLIPPSVRAGGGAAVPPSLRPSLPPSAPAEPRAAPAGKRPAERMGWDGTERGREVSRLRGAARCSLPAGSVSMVPLSPSFFGGFFSISDSGAKFGGCAAG
ncbi:uncharacterized protein LOC133220583, partial [Neopsephotus bourkii]|uniref:uncharacterized protein LOC133220583 n=1 Tax=Neopsephotus bourkii TaxID=309878 RepID=UPI002AA58A61